MAQAKAPFEELLGSVTNLTVIDRALGSLCDDPRDLAAAQLMLQLCIEHKVVPSEATARRLLALEHASQPARDASTSTTPASNLLLESLVRYYCERSQVRTALNLLEQQQQQQQQPRTNQDAAASSSANGIGTALQSTLLLSALQSADDSTLAAVTAFVQQQQLQQQQQQPQPPQGSESARQRVQLTLALAAAHSRLGNFQFAWQVVSDEVRQRSSSALPAVVLVLDSLARRGDHHGARKLLQLALENGIAATSELYAPLIRAHCAAKDLAGAVQVMHEMQRLGIEHSSDSLAAVVDVVARDQSAESLLRKHKMPCTAPVLRALFKPVGRQPTPDSLQYAVESLKQLQAFEIDESLMRNALVGTVRAGLIGAFGELKAVARSRPQPLSRSTCVHVVRTLLRAQQHRVALEFLTHDMRSYGHAVDAQLLALLVPSYFYNRTIEAAEELLQHHMQALAVERDLAVHVALLGEYRDRGSSHEVETLIRKLVATHAPEALAPVESKLYDHLLWALTTESRFDEACSLLAQHSSLLSTDSIVALLSKLAEQWDEQRDRVFEAFAPLQHQATTSAAAEQRLSQVTQRLVEHMAQHHTLAHIEELLACLQPTPTAELLQVLVRLSLPLGQTYKFADLLSPALYGSLAADLRAALVTSCFEHGNIDTAVSLLQCELADGHASELLLHSVLPYLPRLGDGTRYAPLVNEVIERLQQSRSTIESTAVSSANEATLDQGALAPSREPEMVLEVHERVSPPAPVSQELLAIGRTMAALSLEGDIAGVQRAFDEFVRQRGSPAPESLVRQLDRCYYRSLRELVQKGDMAQASTLAGDSAKYSRMLFDLCVVERRDVALDMLRDAIHSPTSSSSSSSAKGARPSYTSVRNLFLRLLDDERFNDAIQVMRYEVALGVLPSAPDVYALVKRMCRAGKPLEARKFLERQLPELGLPATQQLYNMVASSLFEVGRVEQAVTLLYDARRRGQQPNLASYRVLLLAHAKRGNVPAAEAAWREMHEQNIKPLWRNYLSMFETYCNAQQPDKALEFAHRHADSFELSQQACTMLLSTSAAAGNVDVVRHLLRTLMPAHGLVPDRVAFFVAMQKLLAASQPRACLELFELACDNEQEYGVVLDARVINLAIQAHLQLHDERKALELLEHELPKRGLEATIADLNSLLSFYARENRPVEFRLMLAEVHRRKLQPDALTYHLAIAMNTRTGHAHKALEYLARLFADGIRPLEHTWELAFELATQRGDLETFLRTMESFHERVSTTDSHQRVPHNNNLNNHNEPDPKIKKLVTELCTRLLVAYCQGGRTDHAARVLAMMDQANLPFDVDALDFYSRQYYFGARTNDAADDDPW